MNQEKLNTLKDLLRHEEDFSVIGSYFFDHFADHRTFTTHSKRYDSKVIKMMLKAAISHALMYTPVELRKLTMLDMQRLGIIHGAFMVEGYPGCSFFYINSSNQGMAMLCKADGYTEFIRITPQNTTGETLQPNFLDDVASVEPILRVKDPN